MTDFIIDSPPIYKCVEVKFQFIPGNSLYPLDVNCKMCSRSDIRHFAEEAKRIGVQYVGLCCGNAANFMRELAEVYGRTPEACKYSPDLSQNILVGEVGNKEIQKIRRSSLGNYVASDLAKMRVNMTKHDTHHEVDE